MRIEYRETAGAAVVSPRGVLDRSTYGTLRTALVKLATDEPRALVVDLTELEIPQRSAFALFTSVSVQLAEWPGLPLLLVSGDRRSMPRHLRRFVAVCPSVPAAMARIDEPPLRRVARCTLPNSLGSAPMARRFVRATCAAWEVSGTQDAVMVACELVENTLLHTYYAPTIRLELRRGLLTVAVYDDDPTPAELVEPVAGESRRGGLALVAALARSWGCLPTRQGGKVVWATLPADG